MTPFNEIIKSIDTLPPMGLEAIEHTENVLEVKMPLKGNSNHFKAAYAGAMFTLAEFPFGLLIVDKMMSMGIVPVLGEMSMRYLAPATSDLTLRVEVTDEEYAEIEKNTLANGKMKIERTCEIKDAKGTVVATSTATYFTVQMKV